MNCIICTDEILPQPISGWDKGHNPYPVKDKGRCCEDCNSTIVVPTRLIGLNAVLTFVEAKELVKENNIE